MTDKRQVQEDLTKAFINYQWTLEHPMTLKPADELRMHFFKDVMFYNKVSSLVAGVMHIIEKNTDD